MQTNKHSTSELIKDLQHFQPNKRRKAIWELAQQGDSRAMQPLVKLMIKADSQESSLILEAISRIATRTLKPLNQALAIALQDENSQVRQNALRLLVCLDELIPFTLYQEWKTLVLQDSQSNFHTHPNT